MPQLSANEQLTAESAMTQSGDIAGAVRSSQVYTTGAPIEEAPSAALTSEEAAAATEANQTRLDEMTTPAEASTEPTSASQEPVFSEGTQAALTELESYSGQLNAAVATLGDDLSAEVAEIEAIMNRRIQQMEVTNQAILGAQTKIGVRSGRQRMHREVQTSILGAEERAGIQRISDLEMQKVQLIREAKQANNAKQWELLDKKMAAVLKASELQETAIHNQKSLAMQEEQLAIQRSQEARAERTSRLDEATDLLSSGTGLTPDLMASLDVTYGAGFANALIEASEEQALAGAAAADFEFAEKLVDMLSKLPEGRSIELNGVEYEGFKEVDANTYQFNKTDNAGNVSTVTVDKATGELINVVSAGNISTTKKSSGSGGGTTVNAVISFDEFLSEFEKNENMSIDINNESTMSQVTNLYDDYLKTSQQAELSATAKEVMNNPFLYKSLGTSDRKKILDEYSALGVDTTFLPLNYSDSDLSTSPWSE